jgi:hypothetical protein
VLNTEHFSSRTSSRSGKSCADTADSRVQINVVQLEGTWCRSKMYNNASSDLRRGALPPQHDMRGVAGTDGDEEETVTLLTSGSLVNRKEQ